MTGWMNPLPERPPARPGECDYCGGAHYNEDHPRDEHTREERARHGLPVHSDDFGNPPQQLSDNDFVAYLVDTLIPDLLASGSEATAEDFQRCVRMIEARDQWLSEIEDIVGKVHQDL